MTAKLARKIAGITKEIVAEVVGDQKLQDAGRQERKDADRTDQQKPASTAGHLHDLT